jgi:hypothetical protein
MCPKNGASGAVFFNGRGAQQKQKTKKTKKAKEVTKAFFSEKNSLPERKSRRALLSSPIPHLSLPNRGPLLPRVPGAACRLQLLPAG